MCLFVHWSSSLLLTIFPPIFVYVLYSCIMWRYNNWTQFRIGLVLWHINPSRLFNSKSSLYMYIRYIRFGLVWFKGISTTVGYLMPNPLYTYILNIWFGWVLWHINHCRLLNAKSSLYINIKYIWFGLVSFYGISTLENYLMLNPLYTYCPVGWIYRIR